MNLGGFETRKSESLNLERRMATAKMSPNERLLRKRANARLRQQRCRARKKEKMEQLDISRKKALYKGMRDNFQRYMYPPYHRYEYKTQGIPKVRKNPIPAKQWDMAKDRNKVIEVKDEFRKENDLRQAAIEAMLSLRSNSEDSQEHDSSKISNQTNYQERQMASSIKDTSYVERQSFSSDCSRFLASSYPSGQGPQNSQSCHGSHRDQYGYNPRRMNAQTGYYLNRGYNRPMYPSQSYPHYIPYENTKSQYYESQFYPDHSRVLHVSSSRHS